MKLRIPTALLTLTAVFAAGIALPLQARAQDRHECELAYDMKGWSIFYRAGKGDGTITCSDGASIPVRITAHSGGPTLGVYEVIGGRGKFSKVYAVEDLFGTYFVAMGHAGAGAGAEGRGLFKGNASLSMTGTGTGINLGIAFGGLTIRRR